MRTFVDTSALYALVDADDAFHEQAAAWFVAENDAVLFTHNYVVVEAAALVRARLPAGALRGLFDALLPVVSVSFVDERLHAQAQAAFLASSRRVSFVDRVSFEFMRSTGIDEAFAFDDDFASEGFALVPKR